MKRAIGAVAACLLIVLAGCGQSPGSGGASDPATLAPQSTLAYASLEIAPQGAEKAGFDAAFGKLLGADPETKLGEAFTKAASTSGKLDYATDVKPWLGETVSAVVTGVAPHSADYALLIASTDDSKAQASIDKDLGGHPQTGSYRGVTYDLADRGTVNAVVDHYVVAGTLPAFKQIVDTAKDGNSLADSDQWKNSVGSRGDGKVGLAYVDVKALLQSLTSHLPGLQSLAGPLLVGMVDVHPFVGTLEATPDALIGDLSSPGTKPDPNGPGAASSALIDKMPADSLVAAAIPQVGALLQKVATALQANPLIGSQYQRIVTQIRARSGIDLQRDVIGTLGDVGVFVQGSKATNVNATLWLQSNQPTRLRGAVTKARRLAPHGAPHLRVTVARHIAAGSGGTLADTGAFTKAAALIGSRPTVFVNFARALQLGAALPHHRNDPHFQRALPHLRHIEYLAVGTRQEDGLDVIRGVLGLQ